MFKFATLLAIACAASSLATPAQLETDLGTLLSQIQALDAAIVAFPNTGGSLVQALAIHSSAVTLTNTVKTTTADATSTGPLSEADGQTVLADTTKLVGPIQTSLSDIVSKKAAFTALPVGGIPALVLQDLTFLSGNTTLLENVLIANAPADLKTQANALKSQVDSAFATAIAAYTP